MKKVDWQRYELYGDQIGAVEYVDYMGNDLTVVNAARVSFGKRKSELGERDKKLIRYLIEHKHTSTLEHCSVTFRFTVPLFIRSQHHRHRTWSYNEISRRYTDYDIQFYEPDTFRTQHKSNRQASEIASSINPRIFNTKMSDFLKAYHKTALSTFNLMVDNGVCREQARGILPQNMYTQYYGTANLNNILKFVELRTHDGAQWEIQQVAKAVLRITNDLFPHTVGAYKEVRGFEQDKENE